MTNDRIECTCGECFKDAAPRLRPCVQAHLDRIRPPDLGALLQPPTRTPYMPQSPKGCVYFVRAPRSKAIKIGFTLGDPFVRMAALQTGNPDPLELVAALPGSREDEGAFHARFKPQRLTGEWFTDDRELRAFIDGMLAMRPNITATFEQSKWLELSFDEVEEISLQVLHHREMKKMMQSMSSDDLRHELDEHERDIDDAREERMRARRARWASVELADRPSDEEEAGEDDA